MKEKQEEIKKLFDAIKALEIILNNLDLLHEALDSFDRLQELERENAQLKMKLNKLSSNEPKLDAIVFYQNNFGMLTPAISEDVLDWIDLLGDEIVVEALKRSLEQNKTTWGYTKAILTAWHKKGLKTIEQIKAEEVEYRNRQNFKKGNREEILPDWFKNRNQQQEAEHDPEAEEEMKRILERYQKNKT